ncbi:MULTISPECIES: Gfo/Idh/MocA family protein [Protofrankia]|uniref:Trans-1,2-dihydrobenzene-1,2-diol dehydrogenase n=1 Tax=Candidatus Protofrankia datiscae TaxID=2716812 RepID=F8AUW4_9ACTN|nr:MULTISPECIES: Gfo/Idh/MocA family oxidoreductase [Protofrankia]AEH08164.1 Trans-1,2-dihydrobenzene-1,2-diol dehydrogenase [Candidatus Protofrankia datiscae]
MDQVRIGILGAARIAPTAIMKPAARLPTVAVVAVADRHTERADRFAEKYAVPVAHESYDALLDDPDVDAVYNPLPNALHAQWTLRAIEAGKHVLCEKPFTANEVEARAVAEAAASAGVVVTEAFHYRYHPLAERIHKIVRDGSIGTVRSIRTWMCIPWPLFDDEIRYSYELGGGAMMDTGCYAVHCMRLLGAGEPKVVSARALLHAPRIDRAMTAEFSFPDGSTGRIDCSLWSRRFLRIAAHVTGDRGELRVANFVRPHVFNQIRWTTQGRTRWETVRGETTFDAQLRAFARAVLYGEPTLTPAEDAVVTMRLIDDVYRTAGLPPRGLAG